MNSDKYSHENKEVSSQTSTPLLPNSVTVSNDRSLGLRCNISLSKFQKSIIINHLNRFRPFRTLTQFHRRITTITWHPTYPQISVAATKGGDLKLYNFRDDTVISCTGPGTGASILGIKCSDKDPYTVYIASMFGRIYRMNLLKEKSTVLYAFETIWDNWFSSLDICHSQQLLLSGDCLGKLYLMTTAGVPIWMQKKVHGCKITHCEFNPKDPNIFVTSSFDQTVMLWDVRSLSETKVNPLMVFKHLKAVNSASFSPSNGHTLVTTDRHSELRVYSSPCWNEIVVISHPHHHFQHITPMKAVWHPMEDIIIVGRYSDTKVSPDDFKRTIDFYDGSNGALLHQFESPYGKITSLCEMNSTRDILAVATGLDMVYLKDSNIL